MKRLLMICCAISVLSGCAHIRPINRLFDTTTPNYVNGAVISPDERYYLAGGVSFVPPGFTVLNTPTVIRNDSIRFGFYYRKYGAYGSVRVASGVNSSEEAITPRKKSDANLKRKVTEKNARRAKTLAGSMEEHWQAEKQKMSIRDMVARMEVRKDDELVSVIPNFDKSEWEGIAKESFLYFLADRRARLKSVPKDTYQAASIKGWDCLQVDEYMRLGTPLGEFAQRTGGGVEHNRAYSCYIRPDLVIWVHIGMDLAPSISLDYDKILRPLLESIEVDQTLPDTYTTFSIMTAKNKARP